MKKNLLVTLADKNYLDAAKQLFSSVYFNSGWNGDYMLLSYDIPKKELQWFRDRGIIVRKRKSYNYNKKNLSKKFLIYCMKFDIFSLEFKKWKNIVFLDSDIIVRGSLEKLAEVRGFWAVEDYTDKMKNIFKYFKNNKKLFSNIKKQFDLNDPCFNSGVLAYDTDVIKQDSFEKMNKLAESLKLNPRFTDQDAYNIYFYKKWQKLPNVYNIHPFHITHPILTIHNANIKALILHFSGDYKPWNPKYCFYKEWKNNFNNANLVDARKPLISKNIWNNQQIQENSRYLKKRMLIYAPILKLDRLMGMAGILLKKIPPNFYNKIKI